LNWDEEEREEKGREGKRREGKGREEKGREEKGSWMEFIIHFTLGFSMEWAQRMESEMPS
jgi:hypothetical protein